VLALHQACIIGDSEKNLPSLSWIISILSNDMLRKGLQQSISAIVFSVMDAHCGVNISTSSSRRQTKKQNQLSRSELRIALETTLHVLLTSHEVLLSLPMNDMVLCCLFDSAVQLIRESWNLVRRSISTSTSVTSRLKCRMTYHHLQ
jgi:hypothetical protein